MKTATTPVKDPTKRFSDRVDNYVRYRPGYPAGIIPLLRDECGLTCDSVIADIGSGTGKLTELFLANGNRVFGVEPNGEMREAGERHLKDYPNFTSVDGRAEATTLPDGSADLVTAGQAFHWFDLADCRREFQRVLKPGGWVVLAWNDRRLDVRPFAAAYEKLLCEFGTDYEQVRHARSEADKLRDFYGFTPEMASLQNSQRLDFGQLKGRLLSSSYAPGPGQPRHDEMLAALKRLFDEYAVGGIVTFDYDTLVYYGQISDVCPCSNACEI